jgi:hypothetical protein
MVASADDFRHRDKVTTLVWGNREPVGDVVAIVDCKVRVRWHGGDVDDMDPGELRFVEWDTLLERWRTVDEPGR